MRSAAVGTTVLIMLLSMFVSLLSIETGFILKDEAHSLAVSSTHRAMMLLYEDTNKEAIQSNEDFKNAAVEAVEVSIPEGKEADVCIYGCDWEKGMIDVEVSIPYKTIWGLEKETSYRTTMIMENKADE